MYENRRTVMRRTGKIRKYIQKKKHRNKEIGETLNDATKRH